MKIFRLYITQSISHSDIEDVEAKDEREAMNILYDKYEKEPLYGMWRHPSQLQVLKCEYLNHKDKE